MRNFIWRLKKMLDGRNVRTRSVRELVAMKELLNARECGEDRFYLLERNRCPRDPLGECTTERRLTHCLHVRSPTLARSANWVPKTFYFAALDENSDACHLWTISSQYLLKTMKTRIKQLSWVPMSTDTDISIILGSIANELGRISRKIAMINHRYAYQIDDKCLCNEEVEEPSTEVCSAACGFKLV